MPKYSVTQFLPLLSPIHSTWSMEPLPPFGSTTKLQDILLEEEQLSLLRVPRIKQVNLLIWKRLHGDQEWGQEKERKAEWKAPKAKRASVPVQGRTAQVPWQNQSQLAIDLGLGLDCDTSAWKWLSSWLICKTPRKILGPSWTKAPCFPSAVRPAPWRAAVMVSASAGLSTSWLTAAREKLSGPGHSAPTPGLNDDTRAGRSAHGLLVPPIAGSPNGLPCFTRLQISPSSSLGLLICLTPFP